MSTGYIISMTVTVHIPFAQSLKEKRRHIKSLKDKIHQQFNASVAEIDCLNEWQKSVIGIAMVSNDRTYLEKIVNSIETFLLQVRDIVITDIHLEWV